MPDEAPRPITQTDRATIALFVAFEVLQDVADEVYAARVTPTAAAQTIAELGFAVWMDTIAAAPGAFHGYAQRLADDAVEVMPGRRVDDAVVAFAIADPAGFIAAIRDGIKEQRDA